MATFKEAFYTRFFEVQNNMQSKYVAFMCMEIEMPFNDVLAEAELEQHIKRYKSGVP